MLCIRYGHGDDPRAAPRVPVALSFPAAPEVVSIEVDALIDTASPWTILPGRANRVGQELWRVELETPKSTVGAEIPLVGLERIALGESEPRLWPIFLVSVEVAGIRSAGEAVFVPGRQEVTLGRSCLSAFKLSLDFERHELTLERAPGPRRG